jgi:hypothetical protein
LSGGQGNEQVAVFIGMFYSDTFAGIQEFGAYTEPSKIYSKALFLETAYLFCMSHNLKYVHLLLALLIYSFHSSQRNLLMVQI